MYMCYLFFIYFFLSTTIIFRQLYCNILVVYIKLPISCRMFQNFCQILLYWKARYHQKRVQRSSFDDDLVQKIHFCSIVALFHVHCCGWNVEFLALTFYLDLDQTCVVATHEEMLDWEYMAPIVLKEGRYLRNFKFYVTYL